MNEFYTSYQKRLIKRFPSLREREALNIQNIITPQTIFLSQEIYDGVSDSIKALFQLSRLPEYQEVIRKYEPSILEFSPNNAAVLMAYDFHIDNSGQPRLIEINTNASGFLFCNELYQADTERPEFLDRLKSSFKREVETLFPKQSVNALIIDEEPTQQKMFNEFLMYRDLMKSWGWNSDIVDVNDLTALSSGELYHPSSSQAANFIYNRFCDFKFKNNSSKELMNCYSKKLACFSPNPFEYTLLADKERLINWSQNNWLRQFDLSETQHQQIERILIPTRHIKEFESSEKLWADRKTLFFKPKESFGGKSTYRGRNISRKVFERLMQEDTVVQEYIPAPTIVDSTNSESPVKWKYDIRFYVYKDEIQMAAGRIYQGQVTNFSTPGGGFARIHTS